MIELLPYFVAGTALCTIGAGAIVGALVKAPLLRLMSGNSAVRLPFGPLCATAMAEVAIMAISFFVALSKLGSGPPANGGSGALFVGALLAASGMLSWVVNLIPNLYLLGKASDGARPWTRHLRPEYAALMALHTPFFTCLLFLLLYLGVR